MFTFLKARGQGVGSSLVEEDKLDLAKELEEKAAKAGVEIILPSDLIVADKFAEDAATQTVAANAIPDGWMGLDNGPDATKEIQAALKQVCGACLVVCLISYTNLCDRIHDNFFTEMKPFIVFRLFSSCPPHPLP